MRTSKPDALATVLFGKGKRAILSQLFGNPDRRFYVREIARAADVAPSTLTRDLSALTGAGVLQRIEEGRQVYYRANSRCPAFEELKGLVTKTFGASEQMRSMLAPFEDRISLAFIYGSVARGDQGAGSDLDLMVVGNVRIADMAEDLLKAEKRLARSVSPTIYTAKEFREKTGLHDHFLSAVLATPLVFLIGDRNDLERLVGKPSKAR